VHAMRLIAVILGGTTTLLVMSIGWGLGGRTAGWLSGLVWAITPVIFETENLAIPDGFVYFGSALSITLAVQAWKRDAPSWLLGSLIGALIAIYAKYAPVYALIPCAGVTLCLLRRNPRRTVPWVLAMAVVSAAAAAYLIFGYGALGLENREANTFREIGLELITNPARFFNNLSYAVLPIAMPVLALGSHVNAG
jgi:4-amino-4-deoxy-L-arabinose transferase-like glycosyltransferase